MIQNNAGNDTDRSCALKINDRIYYYPSGISAAEIAADFQKEYENEILLVSANGKVQDLNYCVTGNSSLSFLTLRDKAAFLAYERSATLIMLKAFRDTVGKENAPQITVDFSASRALFCRVKGGLELTEELLKKVEEAMKNLVSLDLPIVVHSVVTEDAIRSFREAGMPEKADLLHYSRRSHTNVCVLDDYEDYFYGPMLISTSSVKLFSLQLFEDGFVLRIPTTECPDSLPPFEPSIKVFKALHDSVIRSDAANISTVADLNRVVSSGKTREMILAQEAITEKRIGDIAEEIVRRGNVRFVMIAGPSSSGKTTFSNRLSTQLRAMGMCPHPIEVDNYFKNREDTPKDANGEYDFECLGAVDVEGFNRDMNALINGEAVQLPSFNFAKGKREYAGSKLQIGEKDILVIEGIHCLNDDFSYALPKESKFRIYVSCLTSMNLDEHNRIPTTDSRLLRRMVRDARTRGADAASTIKRWPSVGNGERKNIFPFQDSADVVFNTAHPYETSILKVYAEPLLFSISSDAPEAAEAKRLLKLLDYFLAIPVEDLPTTSLVREFAGGGIYKV